MGSRCCRLPAACCELVSGILACTLSSRRSSKSSTPRWPGCAPSATRYPASAGPIGPRPDRWSIAECVAHLNLTSTAYLPLLRGGLDEARRSGRKARARYRRDLGRVAPVEEHGAAGEAEVQDRRAVRAARRIDRAPSSSPSSSGCRRVARPRPEADGLPIDRVKIASPFNTRLRYNVFSAFSILPRHQHRHLWQAEQHLKIRSQCGQHTGQEDLRHHPRHHRQHAAGPHQPPHAAA